MSIQYRILLRNDGGVVNTIIQKKTIRKGEVKWANIKYPSNMRHAIRGLISLMVADENPKLEFSASPRYPENICKDVVKASPGGKIIGVDINVSAGDLRSFITLLEAIEAKIEALAKDIFTKEEESGKTD